MRILAKNRVAKLSNLSKRQRETWKLDNDLFEKDFTTEMFNEIYLYIISLQASR